MSNTNTPTKDEANKIKQFINLAFEYNKTHNLFVRTSPEDIYETDVKESLTTLKYLTNIKTLLDIGTGAGLPGMVIAITRPDIKVTLAESNRKKTYFIKKTIKQLGLKNTEVVEKHITNKSQIGKFDIITARAFASTSKIIKTCDHLLKPNGRYVLLKGKEKKILEELKTINKNQHKYEIIKLDNKNKERHILLISNKKVE